MIHFHSFLCLTLDIPFLGPSMFDAMNNREKKGENFVRKIGVDLEDLYKVIF